MTHYVLLKFADGTDKDGAERLVRETYAALDRELDYLHDPVIRRSCVERDSNSDIMVTIELDGPEFLQPYLTHPLHLKMAGDLKAQLTARTTFDHE